MLRKDLKLGDIFRYTTGLGGQFIVSDHPDNSQLILGAITHASTASSCKPDAEIVLVKRADEEQINQPPSIVDPPHYRSLTPEPIDVIEAWNLDRYLSNVVKYISRAGEKPGAAEIDDLKKARRWLTRKINKLEGRTTWEYKD